MAKKVAATTAVVAPEPGRGPGFQLKRPPPAESPKSASDTKFYFKISS